MRINLYLKFIKYKQRTLKKILGKHLELDIDLSVYKWFNNYNISKYFSFAINWGNMRSIKKNYKNKIY